MYDCTFRMESLAQLEMTGLLLGLLWALLTAVKFWGLLRIFHLTAPKLLLFSVLLGALGIAFLPYLLERPDFDKPWIFFVANLLIMVLMGYTEGLQDSVRSSESLNDWGRCVLHRCINSAWGLLGGFYLYHLWSYILLIGPSFPSLLAALLSTLFIAGVLFGEDHTAIWFNMVVGLFMGAQYAPLMPLAGLLMAMALSRPAWRERNVPMMTGVIIALFIAVWSTTWPASGGVSFPYLWLSMATAAALLLLAIVTRHWFPLLPLLAVAALTPGWSMLIPETQVGRGMLYIAVSFVMMIAGALLNRHLENRVIDWRRSK